MRDHSTRWLRVLFCLCVWLSPLGHAAVVTVTDAAQKHWIGPSLQYIEDTDNALSFYDVAGLPDAAWKTNQRRVLNQGFTTVPHWFKFELSTLLLSRDHVLLLEYVALDNVDIFIVNDQVNAGLPLRYRMGDQVRFDSRPIDFLSYAVPFELGAQQTAQVYIRIDTQGNMIVPLSVSSKQYFDQQRNRIYMLYGIILGVLLITAAYNFLIWLRARENLFASFSLFSLSIAMLFCTQSGIFYQYLWLHPTVWEESLIPISMSLTAATHFWFSRLFLFLRGRLERIYRHLSVCAVVIAVLSPAIPYSIIIKPLLFLSMLACLFSFCVAAYLSLQHKVNARIYILAWSGFTVGLFVSAGIRFEFIPYVLWTDMAGIIGTLATMVALSSAISDRINREKLYRIQAQEDSIKHLEMYEDLYENSVEGLFIFSLDGGLLRINTAFLSLLGYDSVDEAMRHRGRDVTEFYKDSDEYFSMLKSLHRKESVLDREVELIRKDGVAIWVSMSMRLSLVSPLGNGQIEGAVFDISQRKSSERELAYLASHDPLTELFNRRVFENKLHEALDRSRIHENYHCVLYLDLDQFKLVNDTCGHTAGDILLHQLSQLILSALAPNALLARLGGDEFGVLITGARILDAMPVAERLLEVVQHYRFSHMEKVFTLGVSIGIVEFGPSSESVERIMSFADTACYSAKDAGRNQIHVHSASNIGLRKRRSEMEIVSAINVALEKNRFALFRQDIVASDAVDEVFGFEMLVRMIAEDGTLIPPNQFLPAAERYNLIGRVDRWVITQSLKWLSCNPAVLQEVEHCSINLSGQTLGDDRLTGFILQALEQSSVPAHKICFEVTESVASQNMDVTLNFINVVKKAGCRFSLDDFGSGFSSYGYLKSLPVDYLKIDGAFVVDIANDPVDFAMVKSIDEVAKAMGVKTVAEYVESSVIMDRLRDIGVDFMQGYGVAKPLRLPLQNMEGCDDLAER